MKRLLWVTPIPPCFDAGGGGQIRQAHLLDALADRFEVSLVVAGALADERVRRRMHSVQEVLVGLDRDPRARWRRRLRDLRWLVLQRDSDEVARHAKLRRALGPLAATDLTHDVVCVEYIGLAPIIPRQRRGLWTLTLHNLNSVMARHNAAIAPGLRQRLMLGLEERNARRLEQWALGAYDLVAVASDEDAQSLGASVAVVPNGVDADRFRCSALPAAPRLLFTGALHTLPNRDGICWFCEAVWPKIRGAVPEANLDIVGADPPPEVLELEHEEGVRVHPNVPDVVPFLERARVAVVPLRIGTGSRLKVLEAMAAGRPVVGTAIGVGGIDVVSAREVMVADGAQEFAAAVIRCMTDTGFAQGLTVRARALVEDRYGWRGIGTRYASLLEERISLGPGR